jgi:hypothetical protein
MVFGWFESILHQFSAAALPRANPVVGMVHARLSCALKPGPLMAGFLFIGFDWRDL